MKKIILLFAVCLVFSALELKAQGKDSQEVSNKMQLKDSSPEQRQVNLDDSKLIQLKKELADKEERIKNDLVVAKRVAKTDDGVLKVAPSIQRKQIIGNRPIIGNVPLEKHKEEELVPIKVK